MPPVEPPVGPHVGADPAPAGGTPPAAASPASATGATGPAAPEGQGERGREGGGDGPPLRATARFMWRHPAHWVALGFGSGLSPKAPGTVGTLWAWAAYLVLSLWLDEVAWAWLLAASAVLGWWACTRCAQHLRQSDPGAIVWDEVLAFWLVLWLLMPAGFWMQLAAFALFRLFDAAKPGPVGYADRRFKRRPGRAIGWREGFGILFDDLVAAGCTLLVLALWKAGS